MKRSDVPAGESLCDYCSAKCCRYFAFPIDRPKKRQDFDYLRWFMLHGRVAVFVDDDVWFLMVYADCKHLQPDHRCGIYETRPEICRGYSTDDCEFDGDGIYDKFFETPEQLWEYAEAILPPENAYHFSAEPANPATVQLPVVL